MFCSSLHLPLTMSFCTLCSSLTMNIISNRLRMVGIKSMFCGNIRAGHMTLDQSDTWCVHRLTASPLVSSQRPNTELAAARTEQREFSVVVIPACSTRQQGDQHHQEGRVVSCDSLYLCIAIIAQSYCNCTIVATRS